MSLSLIDTGTNQDDGTGDTLRGAFVKVNANFTEIYNELGGTVLSNLRMSGNTITTDNTNGTIILNPNGTGAVQVEAALVVDSSITATSLQINGDANITGSISGSFALTDVTSNGTLTANGDTNLGNAITDTITATARFDSDLLPSTNNARDLGSSALNWKDVHSTTVQTGSITTTGSVTIGGDLTVGGTLNLGDDTTDSININAELDSHLVPNVDSKYNIGSTSKKYLNVFVDALQSDQARIGELLIENATITTETSNQNIVLDPQGTGIVNVNGKLRITGEMQVSGTQTVDMGSNKVQSVATPTLATDAANKLYVDNQATETLTLTNKTLTTPTLTTPVANAGIQLKNGATSAGFLEFFEDSDNGTNKVTLIGPASTADVTLTLPAATDTLVGLATTDTLTNKTLTSPAINTPTVNSGATLTATSTELNVLDGNATTGKNADTNTVTADSETVKTDAADLTVGTTAVEGTDGIVTNDQGAMRQTSVDTFDTYLSQTSKTLSNKSFDTPAIRTGSFTTDNSVITADDLTTIRADAGSNDSVHMPGRVTAHTLTARKAIDTQFNTGSATTASLQPIQSGSIILINGALDNVINLPAPDTNDLNTNVGAEYEFLVTTAVASGKTTKISIPGGHSQFIGTISLAGGNVTADGAGANAVIDTVGDELTFPATTVVGSKARLICVSDSGITADNVSVQISGASIVAADSTTTTADSVASVYMVDVVSSPIATIA